MFRVLLAGLIVSLSCLNASAQGLIWSLPEDGKQILYSGSYTLTDVQAGTQNEDITTTWKRELVIKSVGKASGDYNGQSVDCRWVEFVLTSSRDEDAGQAVGPVGDVIYKVLIPEESVVGSVLDDKNLLVSLIPIVRGYRKIGDGKVEDLEAGALQVYPLLTMLMHYQDVSDAGSESPNSPVAQTAKKVTAEQTIESRSIRIKNNATMWQSDEVPFGLAKWEVVQLRERKAETDPRSNFTKTSEVKTVMTAEKVGDAAQSALPDNN